MRCWSLTVMCRVKVCRGCRHPECAHCAPRQVQANQRAGQQAAQSAPGDGADDRTPQERQAHGRCHLQGETGDRLLAVLRAAGDNIHWLLRMVAKNGVAFLAAFFGVGARWRVGCRSGSTCCAISPSKSSDVEIQSTCTTTGRRLSVSFPGPAT